MGTKTTTTSPPTTTTTTTTTSTTTTTTTTNTTTTKTTTTSTPNTTTRAPATTTTTTTNTTTTTTTTTTLDSAENYKHTVTRVGDGVVHSYSSQGARGWFYMTGGRRGALPLVRVDRPALGWSSGNIVPYPRALLNMPR